MADSDKRMRVEVWPGKFSEPTPLVAALYQMFGSWTWRTRGVDRCTVEALARAGDIASLARARRAGSRK